MTGSRRYNVMMIDPEGRTSLLLKSILIGSDCRVSISGSRSTIRAKLETCLFDGAIVDVANRREADQIRSLIDESLPSERSFPVGTITDDPDIRLSPPELTIERPIRIHRFQQLVRRMKHRLGNRGSPPEQSVRSFVQCRIQLPERGRELPASTVNINPRGLLARLNRNSGDEPLNDRIPDSGVTVHVSLPDGTGEMSLRADETFTERGSDDIVTGVGFRFRSETEQGKLRRAIRALKEQEHNQEERNDRSESNNKTNEHR